MAIVSAVVSRGVQAEERRSLLQEGGDALSRLEIRMAGLEECLKLLDKIGVGSRELTNALQRGRQNIDKVRHDARQVGIDVDSASIQATVASKLLIDELNREFNVGSRDSLQDICSKIGKGAETALRQLIETMQKLREQPPEDHINSKAPEDSR